MIPSKDGVAATVGFGAGQAPYEDTGSDSTTDSAVAPQNTDASSVPPDSGLVHQEDTTPTKPEDQTESVQDIPVVTPPPELQCMDAAECIFGCGATASGCEAECKTNASEEVIALVDDLVQCQRNICGGMNLLAALGCAANNCACAIGACGECPFDCAASGENSCLKTFHCLVFDCEITSNVTLPEALGNACCIGECFAQASPEASQQVGDCLTCAAAQCPNKPLMNCAVAECAEVCMGCAAQ